MKLHFTQEWLDRMMVLEDDYCVSAGGYYMPVPGTELIDGLPILTHPTYDNIHTACVSLVEQLKDRNIKPLVVVGITRGGLFPAVIISHLLDVPMKTIEYSSKEGAGDNKNHANDLPELDYSMILVVDDICDSGRTLEEVSKHYSQSETQVVTAAVYYKENPGGYVPDFYWHWIPKKSPWIIFPFEG